MKAKLLEMAAVLFVAEVLSLPSAIQLRAQDKPAAYPSMYPLSQYLMEPEPKLLWREVQRPRRFRMMLKSEYSARKG